MAGAPKPKIESKTKPEPESKIDDETRTPGTAPRLSRLLLGDLGRAARAALYACLILGAFEYAGALVATPAHDIRVAAAVRLVFLDFALITLLWLLAASMLGLGAAGARLLVGLRTPARMRAWPGLFTPPPPGFQPAASWLWALLAGALFYTAASGYVTYRAITYFKEPQLTALLLALVQLVLIGLVSSAVYVAGALWCRIVGGLHRRLENILGGWPAHLNPFGRVGPALVLMALVPLPLLAVAVALMPQLAPLVPWRHLLGIAVFLAGVRVAAAYRHMPPRAVRRRRTVALAAAAVVLLPLSLLRIGADHEAKSIAVTGSPLLARLVDVVRYSSDFDRDGYGYFLGENDCAPFDSRIHPLARDIADNGIDEDCNGRDFSFSLPPSYKTGERLPVPPELRRDWNVLLLTIDTVRYDHTGFGGYGETKERDTTPNLDALVDRSVSFTFANAPSAGTMASVPAILTSKFFHSGIALDNDVKPRMPPRLRPQNLLISEIMAQQGYYNGAILTHEYFNDWGLEQGFDTYDNELGADRAPGKVTSHDVTDKAIAWIAQHSSRKWFLWAHYLDPHGHYMDHPGERRFGSTDEDRYDGEIYYTDKHIGRLLKAISTMPGAERTIVIITSDHGDGFGEHGFINHGQALYRELLHVPLVFHIPGVPPRTVDGAVSPLDIVPTVADLIGADHDPAQFEGQSLVPQLFYGKDVQDRVVFAETDWPRPLRAAITSRYKLVYKLQGNLYELYDLQNDPWEKRNIASREREASETMKGYMNDWLERVYYARDPVSNQAAAKLQDYFLDQAPTPRAPVQGVTFDDGRIEVLGFDTDKDAYGSGDKMQVTVYFHVNERPSDDFLLQLEAWLPAEETGGKPGHSARSKRRFTAEGVLPTSRWRKGELIRDRFTLDLPRTWRDGDRMILGLGMLAHRGGPIEPTGPHKAGAPHTARLGEVAYRPAPPAGAADTDTAAPGTGARPGTGSR